MPNSIEDEEFDTAFDGVFSVEVASLLSRIELVAATNPIFASGLRLVVDEVMAIAKSALKTEFELTEQLEQLRAENRRLALDLHRIAASLSDASVPVGGAVT